MLKIHKEPVVAERLHGSLLVLLKQIIYKLKPKKMKTRIFNTAVLLFIAAVLLSFDIPKGWYADGNNKENYEVEIAKGEGMDGSNAATIKCKGEAYDQFGSLVQESSPEKYLGKQVKMTAYVRSEDVKNWAGLWLRVDGAGKDEMLSFDNMQNRGITGTTEWKKYEIILPVPESASRLAYGALLDGTGQIWFDNFAFEVVDNSDNPPAPESSDGTNHSDKTKTVTKKPVNLDFED